MATFGGYAKFPRYQYQTFNPQTLAYSKVSLYALPPDPPPFEPPTDHPVEKDDGEIAKDDEATPSAEASEPPAGINP